MMPALGNCATLVPELAAALRRYRIAAMLAALALAASPLSAHDFWLQPDRFRVEPGTPLAMTLLAGHGADRQRSQIPRRRIVRFAAIEPDGDHVDLRGMLDLGGAADARLQFREAGSHVVFLETDDRAESHLPADRFNHHLESEGLTPALEARWRSGRSNEGGSEAYGRRAKAIIHVAGAAGAASGASAAVTRPVGMTLEIVPEVDPYALPRAARFPVRVFYEGRPLAGALVKLTRLEDDAAPLASQRTGADGRTSFALPPAGTWLLGVVWARPLPAGEATDFETIFSSLGFATAER